jgi:hypothetical protein
MDYRANQRPIPDLTTTVINLIEAGLTKGEKK